MSIILRSTKGSELSYTEVDGNFTDLDNRTSTLETNLPTILPAAKTYTNNAINNLNISLPDGINKGEMLYFHKNTKTFKAMHFDGDNDCLTVGENIADFSTQNFSIVAKISVDNTSTTRAIFGQTNDENYGGYIFSIDKDNNLTFVSQLGNGATQYKITSTKSLTPNTYYNVIVTVNNGTIKLYINETLDTTSTGNPSIIYQNITDSNNLYTTIGDNSYLRPTYNHFFSGNMVYIQFYNKELTLSEISSIILGNIISSNIKLYFDFSSDDPLMDKSGNRHLATIQGDTHIIDIALDIDTGTWKTTNAVSLKTDDILSWNGNDWINKTNNTNLPSGTANGDILSWDGTKWYAKNESSELPEGNMSGEILYYDGNNWITSSIGKLQNGDILSWNGTGWENKTINNSAGQVVKISETDANGNNSKTGYVLASDTRENKKQIGDGAIDFSIVL